jgi:hypothetical protein
MRGYLKDHVGVFEPDEVVPSRGHRQQRVSEDTGVT